MEWATSFAVGSSSRGSAYPRCLLSNWPGRQNGMVPSQSGIFTIKSAWELVWQKRNLSLMDSLLCGSVLPAKISFFAWRLVHNFLPLEVTLRSRGLSFLSTCHCCYAAEEFAWHVFFEGLIATAVWGRFSSRFRFMLHSSISLALLFITWFFFEF